MWGSRVGGSVCSRLSRETRKKQAESLTLSRSTVMPFLQLALASCAIDVGVPQHLVTPTTELLLFPILTAHGAVSLLNCRDLAVPHTRS